MCVSCACVCVSVCVFGEWVICFNLWVQVIITDIINKVIFELKSEGCTQKIIVMDTDLIFIWNIPLTALLKMDWRKTREPITIAQARDESYQTESGWRKNWSEMDRFQNRLACRIDTTCLIIFIWFKKKKKTPIVFCSESTLICETKKQTYTFFHHVIHSYNKTLLCVFCVCYYVSFKIIPTPFLCMSSSNIRDTNTGNNSLVIEIIELFQWYYYGNT